MIMKLEDRVRLLIEKAASTYANHPDRKDRITAQIDLVYAAIVKASFAIDEMNEE